MSLLELEIAVLPYESIRRASSRQAMSRAFTLMEGIVDARHVTDSPAPGPAPFSVCDTVVDGSAAAAEPT